MKTEWDCVDCGIHVIACIPQPDETTRCAECQFIADIEDPVEREMFRTRLKGLMAHEGIIRRVLNERDIKPEESDTQGLLGRLQSWVKQYEDDDPPCGRGQNAAIAAMRVMMQALHQGKGDGDLAEGIRETRRMMEILAAFEGQIHCLKLLRGDEGEEEHHEATGHP